MAEFNSGKRRPYKKRGSTPDSVKQNISKSLVDYWKTPEGIRRRAALARRLTIHKRTKR